MTARLATDPELAAAYRRAHASLSGRARRRRTVGHQGLRRRHARSGEVPSRADRARACQGARASTRWVTRRWRCWPTSRRWPESWIGSSGDRHANEMKRACADRRHRLRHQFDPIVDRRRRRRPAARLAPGDADRAAWAGRRRNRTIRAGGDRTHPNGTGRLRAAARAIRGSQGADGRDVGHPRRGQSGRVLRDDRRGVGGRGAWRGGRGDHRRGGGGTVVPRRDRRIGLRR